MNEGPPSDAVIRTPDQRLRVFVSSTLGELADERRSVSRAISALRLTPVMFELGARPHPPQELYRAYLAQSDIFIGLYWEQRSWPTRLNLCSRARVTGFALPVLVEGLLSHFRQNTTATHFGTSRANYCCGRCSAEPVASDRVGRPVGYTRM